MRTTHPTPQRIRDSFILLGGLLVTTASLLSSEITWLLVGG